MIKDKKRCHSDRREEAGFAKSVITEVSRCARNDGVFSQSLLSMTTSKQYYIYMMASVSGVLYIGVTNDLIRRG
jgi:hypothetical protein